MGLGEHRSGSGGLIKASVFFLTLLSDKMGAKAPAWSVSISYLSEHSVKTFVCSNADISIDCPHNNCM